MDNLEVFAQIKGLVIGRAYNLTSEQIEELKTMVLYYVQDYDYPVLYNVNIGHVYPIMTLPLDAMVLLDNFNQLFQIIESGVRQKVVLIRVFVDRATEIHIYSWPTLCLYFRGLGNWGSGGKVDKYFFI